MDKHLSLIDESKFFYLANFQMLRLEMLLFTIIISSFFFISNNDQYRSLLLTYGISRNKYIISKIITIIIIIILITIFEFLLIMVIGAISKIDMYVNLFKNLLDLIVSICYFSLISILLVQCSDSIYVIIISIVLLLFTSIDFNLDFINYFILVVNENMEFLINRIYYVFLDILLFIINVILYRKRDLQI